MVVVGAVLLAMGLVLTLWPVPVLRASNRLRLYGDPTKATGRQVRACGWPAWPSLCSKRCWSV